VSAAATVLSAAQAEELQRFVNAGRFAAGVASEVRGALGIVETDVLYLCQLLSPATAPGLLDAARDAQAAVSRAIAGMTGVLQLARGGESEVAPLDLRRLVGEVLTELEAPLRGFLVVRELHPLPAVLAGRGGLFQTLVSLLLSAAEASRLDRCVAVALAREKQSALVIIDDGGQRLTPEAFEARLPLTLSRAILQSFGGELLLGRSPLGGSRVTVRLRLA
jgi:C4-dicarboxylate-specific signal transduction histidine kinase